MQILIVSITEYTTYRESSIVTNHAESKTVCMAQVASRKLELHLVPRFHLHGHPVQKPGMLVGPDAVGTDPGVASVVTANTGPATVAVERFQAIAVDSPTSLSDTPTTSSAPSLFPSKLELGQRTLVHPNSDWACTENSCVLPGSPAIPQ